MKDTSANPLAIDLPALAEAIGAHVRSMRNAFYQRPQDFPPAIYLPGARGPRFLMTDVLNWLESRKSTPEVSTTPAAPTASVEPPKRRGRPRKASPAQIARLQARKAAQESTSLPGNGGTRIAFSAARSFLAPIHSAEKAERSCPTTHA